MCASFTPDKPLITRLSIFPLFLVQQGPRMDSRILFDIKSLIVGAKGLFASRWLPFFQGKSYKFLRPVNIKVQSMVAQTPVWYQDNLSLADDKTMKTGPSSQIR